MSELDEIENRIAKIFEEQLNVVVPSVDTDLFESGGLDSLVFVELLISLELEFGVSVALDDMEIDNFRSIERIAEFLREGSDIRGHTRNGGVSSGQNGRSVMDAAK